MPPSACSKRPRRCASAPVNAPFSWPNSSDSSRSAGIADGVERDEGLAGARAVLVQRARDQLLAGAGLAGDQHRDARARQAADGAEHLLHGRRPAEQLRDARRAAPRRRRRAAAPLRGAPHQRHRLVDVEGLGQILERAALVGRHRAAQIRVRGHDDDRQRRARVADLASAARGRSCPACGCR